MEGSSNNNYEQGFMGIKAPAERRQLNFRSDGREEYNKAITVQEVKVYLG